MNTTASDANRSTEAPDATGLFRIWPGDGRAPGSEEWTWQESTMAAPWSTTGMRLSRNVVVPTITVFEPAPGKANGTSMVVAPGGAFHFLMIDHEGYDMARWLTSLGVTAFVLKYRVAKTPDRDEDLPAFRNDLQAKLAQAGPLAERPPMMAAARLLGEEDGRQAIRWVRENAARWNLDRGRIGIAGYSAGGGVSMGTAMQYDAVSRPDYVVGVYPAYRTDLTVPADAPPLFVAVAADDPFFGGGELGIIKSWIAAKRPVELHLFEQGGHGFGMYPKETTSTGWFDEFVRWLDMHGMLKPAH